MNLTRALMLDYERTDDAFLRAQICSRPDNRIELLKVLAWHESTRSIQDCAKLAGLDLDLAA